MVDSVAVFPPGFRVLDENGDLVPGAKITFFQAGTSTPRLVYSDAALTVSLGSTVTCDASGSPVSGGGSDVVIYTGTTPYKIQVTTAANVLVPGYDFDNVQGALDTSTFDLAATVLFPVVPVTTSGTWTVPDLGKTYAVDPTSGQITRTLPTSLAAGNGNYAFARHDGTANAVVIVAAGTDTISGVGDLAGQKSVTLYEKGDSVLLIADGAGWRAQASSGLPHVKFFRIVARQSAPPGSPVTGESYLINSAPTGAWSTFAINDIVTSDGNLLWTRSRPTANSGWFAFVVGEGLYYRYIGSAWRSELAADTTPGTFTIATKADLEAATSLTASVTPGRQQFHPSASKAWLVFNGIPTSPPLDASFNVSSVTDNGTGDYTVNFTVPFSNGFYSVSGWARDGTITFPYVSGSPISAPFAGSCRIRVCNGANATADVSYVCATFFGDQ
jgi:hypothetical protein